MTEESKDEIVKNLSKYAIIVIAALSMMGVAYFIDQKTVNEEYLVEMEKRLDERQKERHQAQDKKLLRIIDQNLEIQDEVIKLGADK